MNKILKNKIFHKFVRWGLGLHGLIHILETLLNIYEAAYMSALLSLFAGLLMLAGACLGLEHSSVESKK